jgi:hypothetical protein
MLTEKCPFCGSFNDVDAALCYFCHKDLPDTPGHKKKRGVKPASPTSIQLPPSFVVKRKSPPGCLIILVTLLFLACLLVIFQAINGMYQLFSWKIQFPAAGAGPYIAYYLQALLGIIDKLLKFPIIVVASVVMIGILGYGLLNLKRWARVLAMSLLSILLIANFALFIGFVMNFVNTTVNDISFLLILFGIGLNIYWLVWFFERRKLFE